jgi:hypothetical protein
MMGTTHSDKTDKVGITLANSLIKQAANYLATFREAHIFVEQSSITLSKVIYADE